MPDHPAAAFKTLVEPSDLHFNSAHFITYGNVCENLHGHNFHARVSVTGANGVDAYVVDFVLLSTLAAAICLRLHDRVLLPGESSVVAIANEDDMVRVESFGKRFLLPRENCLILPVSNVTAEMLAWYLGEELIAGLRERDALANLEVIEVAVEEADRQWGVCRRTLARRADASARG